jgi:hypothetical protein
MNLNHKPFFRCPKCEKNEFGLAKLTLKNTTFMPFVIHCQACCTVIGTVPAKEVIEYHQASSPGQPLE